MISAVRAIARGEQVIGPEILDLLHATRSDGESDPLDTLSTREREVLQLIGEGRTSPDIARRLCISLKTVESHRRHVMRKLGLRNHAELARFALRERLTT